MIDRIEELLESLAAEDEEEREDVLAQKRGAVVSSGLSSERSENGEAPEGRTAFAQSESLGRAANRRSVTTGKRESEDRSGGRTAGEIALEWPGLIAGETETTAESAWANRELWKDGTVWTVCGRSPEMDSARRMATAEREAQTEEAILPPWDGERIWTGLELAARGGDAGLVLEGVRRSGVARARLEQAGLEGLYRQTVQGLRPAAPALPPEQAGRTTREREPGSAASLAVDELDRAVRRDSRRYDGGLSIF